jgi:uncharacterized protein (TIGR02001 family)
MKKLLHSLVLCGLVAVPAVALAEAGPHRLSGNLSFVSDYQFRGVSQTDEDPAIQGGFDYAHVSGFYLGTWASNVELAPASMEWDVYAGYGGSVGELGYNVGLLQYFYPDLSASDTLEVYGGLSYRGFGLKAAYSTGDYFGFADSDGTVYWDASYGYTFENGIGVSAHYGYTAGRGGQADYADWKIGVSKDVAGFALGLAYVDTNDAGRDFYGKDIADGRLLLSVARTF